MVHVGDVLVGGGVVVVLLDDLVEKWSKGVEALVAASIDTDARVGPFAAREDALLERESVLVLSILTGFPDVTGEHSGEKRLGSAWEEGELSNLLWSGEVRSHKHASSFGCAFAQL